MDESESKAININHFHILNVTDSLQRLVIRCNSVRHLHRVGVRWIRKLFSFTRHFVICAFLFLFPLLLLVRDMIDTYCLQPASQPCIHPWNVPQRIFPKNTAGIVWQRLPCCHSKLHKKDFIFWLGENFGKYF